jgi:hypothetical protein
MCGAIERRRLFLILLNALSAAISGQVKTKVNPQISLGGKTQKALIRTQSSLTLARYSTHKDSARSVYFDGQSRVKSHHESDAKPKCGEWLFRAHTASALYVAFSNNVARAQN